MAVLIIPLDDSRRTTCECGSKTDRLSVQIYGDDMQTVTEVVCLWCILAQLDELTELKISRAVRQWLTQRAVQAAIKAEIRAQEEGS